MGLVNEHFTAALPWVTGHLQTVADRIVNPNHDLGSLSSSRSLMVNLDDGTGDMLSAELLTPRVRDDEYPRVLVVHGLGGSMRSHYVQATARGFLQEGYEVVLVDLRGAGASAAHCRYLYHGGRTADLAAVVRAVAGPTGVALVGFSLGGNAILKLLGEGWSDLPLVGGVSVSAPLDLGAATTHLQEMAFGVYSKYLLGKMRLETTSPNLDLSDDDRSAIRSAKSLAEFDTAITARKNGWVDAEEYYRLNSSGQFLAKIRVPTLAIHAVDDPMVPIVSYQEIDWDALARKAPVRRAITRHGGHVGFHEHAQPLPWYVNRSLRHFKEIAQGATPGSS